MILVLWEATSRIPKAIGKMKPLIFCFVGQPATVLVVVGAINGFILPIALGILLVASHKTKIMGAGYHHPAWLTWTGWLVVIFMAYAGINTVLNLL